MAHDRGRMVMMQRLYQIKNEERQHRRPSVSESALNEKLLNEANARNQLEQVIEHLTCDAPRFSGGRGIVICGDSRKYFPSAWININLLRDHGCHLPIEYWYLNPSEIRPKVRELLEPLNVKCVDASAIERSPKLGPLAPWAIKCFAILHCCFNEVLLLDADNVPLVDPTFLFDSASFLQTGAIFWPDHGRLPPTAKVWNLTGVSYRSEPEFESGQIVVNKRVCWKALNIAMWFNDHSDFWYSYLYGDKDTFHFAWLKIFQSYSMPSHGVLAMPCTMCQHDFDGRRIFLHRNKAKWTMRNNLKLRGFLLENRCLEYLSRLDAHWKEIAGVSIYNRKLKSPAEQQYAAAICAERWIYRRIGHESRIMSFAEDGTVAEGMADLELYWDVTTEGNDVVLDIYSEETRTCRLRFCDENVWRGRWDCHEQMPIELLPAPSLRHVSEGTLASEELELVEGFFLGSPKLSFMSYSADGRRWRNIVDALLYRSWVNLSRDPTELTVVSQQPQTGPATPSFGSSLKKKLTASPSMGVMVADCESIRSGAVSNAIQQGIVPQLILLATEHLSEFSASLEEDLIDANFVQVFYNVRTRGWAWGGQALSRSARGWSDEQPLRRPNSQ